MKYPMKLKTERPLFEYLVRDNMNLDYYLFSEFDNALKTAETKSIEKNGTFLIYEVYFNTSTREFHGTNTFKVFQGKVKYDKHAEVDLHLEFYVNAGEWLNPNEEWLEILKKRNETN